MVSQDSKNSHFPHGSVSEYCMVEYVLNLLYCNQFIVIGLVFSFDHYRGRSVANYFAIRTQRMRKLV